MKWTVGAKVFVISSCTIVLKQTNTLFLFAEHYDDVTMGTMASKITSLTIVYTTVYSGADQSKHQSSASLAFVWGIHRGPVNSPHKWPVTRKMFPFDDVIMRRSNFVAIGAVASGEQPSLTVTSQTQSCCVVDCCRRLPSLLTLFG